MKAIPLWGDLTIWLNFPAKNLSHSVGILLCDYIFQPKSIPFRGDLTIWSCSQPKIYTILSGPDDVIIISSQKYIHFWGDLTLWLYPKEWTLYHSEGTWLCDYTVQPKIYSILSGPDYVIILSSPKSIPFRGDLTLWLYPKEWKLSHSEGTWLVD